MISLSTKYQQSFPNQSTFEDFIHVPQHIYPSNSPRFRTPDIVDPTNLQGCYTLFDGKKPAGRFSLFTPSNLNYQDRKVAYIGHYECVENERISIELINLAKEKAKEAGAEYLIGPMDGSTWHTYRFATDYDNPLFLTENHHHLYYTEQFEKAGFKPIVKYVSQIKDNLSINEEKTAAIEEKFRSQGIIFRHIHMDTYEDEMYRVCEFCQEAFKRNVLFTPIDPKIFVAKYRNLSSVIDPEFVQIAENGQGKIVGLQLSVPNHYAPEKHQLISKTTARAPQSQYKGVAHVLHEKMVKKAIEKGYTSVIHAFMFENNRSRVVSDAMGFKPYRTYQLFGMNI